MASFRFRVPVLAALLALFGGSAAAQVVISEVMINPQSGNDMGHEWIEITNVSNSSVSLSNWTLFVSTRKSIGTTEPGSYYWPFPKTGPGALLPAGGRAVIHWMKSGTNAPILNPNHYALYTGTTVYDFLFGLFHLNGQESDMLLPETGGALGLIRTQDAKEVLLPGFWADYVQYGGAGYLTPTIGFPPVKVPVMAGIWTAGTFVPLPVKATEFPLGASLAYSYTGNSHLNYRIDHTPSKGDTNTTGVQISSFGQKCACVNNGKDLLCTLPIPPVISNMDFNFLLTEGVPQSPALVFLSTGASKLPTPYLGCYINLANLLISLPPVITDNNGTAITPLPLPPDPSILGAQIAAQYFLASAQTANGTYCSSNGVLFTIGQ